MNAGAEGASNDPLLEALVYVARSHGRQVSRAGLIAGLPLVDSALTPALLVRAAVRAGLKVSLVDKPLSEFSRDDLPAILFLNERTACVLLNSDGKQVRVVHAGKPPQDVAVEKFAREYSGSAAMLEPEFEFDDRAPALRDGAERHWFWGAMRENLPLYRDVIVAAALVNLFAIALPLFVMNVYDRVVPNNALDTLWVLSTGLGIVLVADFLLRSLRGYFLDLASKRVDIKVSSRIMEHVLGMRLESRPASAGSFAANLRSFESVRDFITSAAITAFIDLPFVAMFLAVIAWISPQMVVPVIVAMALVLLANAVTASRVHSGAESVQRSGAMRNATLIESLIGLETVKTLGAEGVMQRRWEQSAEHLAQSGTRQRLLSMSTVNFAQLCFQLTYVAVVITGVYLIAERELSLGGLIACSMLTGRAMGPLGQIAGLMTQYQSARTALSALEGTMRGPLERPPGGHFLSRQKFEGSIEFRDVSFCYPGTDLNALKSVSFRIKAGEKIAVLGRSGSGKSTLLRLMLGLYQPSGGAVLIDGIDLRQLDPGELRRSTGYVPQDVMLFYGSLRDNLTLGAPHAEDADIVNALEIASLAELINAHPSGIELAVGERGAALSGGQRQGVSLARAVMQDPAILLMDEPTGSMDHSSEEAVKNRLRDYLQGRTMVVITHRTALMDLVDRIIVIDQGRIVADGPKRQVVEALRQGRVGKGV
jgi:ATP-binding cassette subfamily C protein LapB